MANHYDKIAANLKEVRKIQGLIAQGLGKPDEKSEAFRLAKEAMVLFTDDIFKRKAEKLNAKTIWTNQPKAGGFLSEESAKQLDEPIALLDEYLERRRIHSDLSSEKTHIHSTIDGEDQHIFITGKGVDGHAHLIMDGGTGEIRIDPKDKPPHELIRSIRAQVELNTGETVQLAGSSISFVEPQGFHSDVKAYMANKDGYPVLEIYNSGDEDLEDFRVQANWIQTPPEGAQERVLTQFNEVSDYLVMASPRLLNMLKVGARIYAINIPSISVDKKIKITISCQGIRSGKAIQKVFELETPNQYPS